MLPDDKFPARIRSSFLKDIYIACLLNFPLDDVRNLFNGFDFSIAGRTLENREKYLRIWKEDEKEIPLASVVRLADHMEAFLATRGYAPDAFLLDKILAINNGSSVTAEVSLGCLEPMLELLFKKGCREVIFDNLAHVNALLTSHAPHMVIRKTVLGNRLTYHTLQTHDSGFNPDFPKFTARNFTAPMIKNLPSGCGFDAIDQVDVLAERKTPEEIAPLAAISFFGNEARHEGIRFGLKIKFSNWLKLHSLVLPAGLGPVPDPFVILAEKDVKTPDHGRPLLHAGTAYGAPVYLYRISFNKTCRKRHRFSLKDIFASLQSRRSFISKAEPFHERLLETLEQIYCFEYRRPQEALFLNGRKIAKKIPAKCIAKMLQSHVEKGITGFNNDFFNLDETIVPHKLDKRLNVLLKRVSHIFRKHAPGISIERKIGSGRTILQAGAGIRFSVE